jgi:diguanylate cyclase (GGDEF)-like protein/PAS domain S-box-containing protein
LINILLIDDSEDEQFLLQDELVQEGISPSIKRVDNELDLYSALTSSALWDIALVDYAMPGFSAQEALQILKESNFDVPAIVVSGQASEENAVSVMRLGARDYISKNNRFRLIPSIFREIDSHNRRKEQQLFKKQLHQTEQKFAAIAGAAHDAIILMKDDLKIEFWNTGAERVFGYKNEEALGRGVNDIIIPQRYKKFLRHMFLKFPENGKIDTKHHTFEAAALRKNRTEFPVEVSLSSINIENKWVVIAIVRDISQRRELERKLRRLATHDALTGLINRRETILKLKQEMVRFSRYHSPITIFFIDIDNFKNINDKYGHKIGDDTLVDCAHKMRTSMRENDIVGRYGGEEFLLILPETPMKKAYELAERLRLNICQHSIDTKKQIPDYTISIGIAELCDEKMTIDAYINQADKAMYKAKKMGKNKVCIDTVDENHD